VVRTLGGGQANSVFNVVTLTDSDADGLSDAWETQFGFSPTNAADKEVDFDLDGVSNYREYVAGTDPTNSLSFLRINLSTTPGQPTISFGAASNRTYAIDYTDQPGGVWSRLADIFAQPTDRIETIPDPHASSNRFYRAVTPRQP
jgi:hypothetical protein